MKVTTQRTSKPLKLMMFAAFLIIVLSVLAGMNGDPLWIFGFAGGALLWAITRVLIWFFHE